jgi:Fur family ferric uptake transcriptional regulator
MNLAQAYRKLEGAGFRLTPQRDTVLRLLARHADASLSAEDIVRLARDEAEIPVGLATTYRTLELLLELEIVNRVRAADGRARYVLVPEIVEARAQLVCTRCGQVLPVPGHLVADLEARLADAEDFRVTAHEVKFYGVCGACRRD